ncbi:diguanylate cyclase [Dyella ginsengisoli]|uniref:diguanylate cyclase n=1 Tax=Dyella ginsengisoli TaxID=363848 RepID=UPI00034C6741|nr:diguanylate cyclase [Dyella ginsengisoli]
MIAPDPETEARRLARLRTLSVLDTAPEALFDGLAQAAAAALGTPIAAVNLIDADRQWTKAGVGVEVGASRPRSEALCAHAILGDAVLEVPDARHDPRFADNPMVSCPGGIRFYAGAPITLDDGSRLGALCAVDRQPRTLNASQRELLQSLARVASEALQLRLDSLEREVLLERTGRLAQVGGWSLDLSSNVLRWSPQTFHLHDLPVGTPPSLEQALAFYPAEARQRLVQAIERARREGGDWDLELPLVTATGRKLWVRAMGRVEYLDDGQPHRLVGAIQDISIRRQVTTALETSERRFRQMFQYSPGLICTHDHEGVLLSVNPAAARALGYSVGELLGRPLSDFMPESRRPAFRDYLLRIITTSSDSGVMELLAKDGRHLMWQYHNVLDDEADEPYILGHAQDITERFEMEQQLREWSVHDALTGCYNRRYLAELEAGPSRRWGCITVDLDHFKQVNDTYGHQRGDEVLQEMAHFLKSHVRAGDAVVRLGGDEFLMLLRDADDEVTAEAMLRIDRDRATAPIGFTLGAANFGGEVSLDEGLAEADRRLYAQRALDRGG